MKLPRFQSLAVEVTLLVMIGTSLVLVLVLTDSYFVSRKIMVANAEKEARNRANSVALTLQQELRAVAEITENLAMCVETVPLDRLNLLLLIRGVVERQKEIFGSTVAYEPYAFEPDFRDFSPYFYKSPDGVTFAQLGNDSYDYSGKDWYTIPKSHKAPVWSEPYYDEGGGDVIMCTYSFPFFHLTEDGGRGPFRGVVTADVSVNWLTKKLESLAMGERGTCFLISREGTFITAPNRSWIMRESVFSIAQKRGSKRLEEIGREMLTNPSGFIDCREVLPGGDSFLAYSRLPVNGWSLGILLRKRVLFAPVEELFRRSALLGVAGALLLFAVSLMAARSVTKPLRRLEQATSKVATGNLNVDLSEIQRADEIGRLAQAFARMTVDLTHYIRELTEATAARERIQSELSVAARIQRSMLPSHFPAFPDRKDFDIHAIMEPAKEVGGDFYQFFLMDDNRLCFAIGDVSGKGVPAALFMAVTTFLLRSTAAGNITPEEILGRLNTQLSRGNDACMFVTLFCGILNLRTGELLYANGGHNPPMLMRDKEVVGLGPPGGPVVGVMEDAIYRMESLTMNPGETLFTYTDGVTEAFNPNEELFSEERLRTRLSELNGESTPEMIRAVMSAVESFALDAPRADDITMLAVRYDGPKIT